MTIHVLWSQIQKKLNTLYFPVVILLTFTTFLHIASLWARKHGNGKRFIYGLEISCPTGKVMLHHLAKVKLKQTLKYIFGVTKMRWIQRYK